MDTFVEQIVVKKKDTKEKVFIIGVVFAAIVLMGLIFLLLGGMLSLMAILWIAIGYGVWWLVTNQNVEFEYSITNGDVDIDRIVARRKRNRLVSVRGQKIEEAGKYDAARMQARRFDRMVMAAPSLAEEGLYYFTYHSKKNGSTIVIFQPDERVKEAFYKSLPKLIQLDWDKQ